MAKRKATGRTRKAARTSSRPAPAARRKTAKKAAKKTTRRTASRPTAKKTARRQAGATGKKKSATKPIKSATSTRSTKSAPRVAKTATSARKATTRAAARPRSAPPVRRAAATAKAASPRKAPALNRERRTIPEEDEEMIPMPPSTLDLDRSASAVRSGRRGMQQRFAEHTETSPALTGGDVDADWESAYSVGDEAPGGDNPTPDQDIVDDIGRAVGVEYQDNEELKGEEKITKRDAHRWELDPASSEDWDDRD